MNYFNPNLYQNYSYNGNNQYLSQYQNPMQQQPQQQLGLNGKIVDTIDMAKVTEVPIGGYGIFPKADLSEVYIKTWNQNGTTNMLTFKPVSPEPEVTENKDNAIIEILQKIQNLENKIDNLAGRELGSSAPRKKELNINEY